MSNNYDRQYEKYRNSPDYKGRGSSIKNWRDFKGYSLEELTEHKYTKINCQIEKINYD